MNIKTTIAGIAAGIATLEVIIRSGSSIGDWKNWILPVLLAALGVFAKDAPKYR